MSVITNIKLLPLFERGSGPIKSMEIICQGKFTLRDLPINPVDPERAPYSLGKRGI